MKRPAERFRLESRRLAGGVGRGQAEQAPEEWELFADPDAVERAGEAGRRSLKRVIDADPGKVPEKLEVRPICKARAVRDTPALQPVKPSLLGVRPSGGSEPGLADAGLTGHRDNSARTVGEAVEGVAEHSELLLSADEFGRDALAGSRAPACTLTDQSPRRHRLALALEGELTDGLEVEAALREPHRHLAHIRLARRGRGLQALSKDDGIAEDGIVHARLAAKDPRDTVPGVDPDVQRELCVVREVRAEPRQLG